MCLSVLGVVVGAPCSTFQFIFIKCWKGVVKLMQTVKKDTWLTISGKSLVVSDSKPSFESTCVPVVLSIFY